MMPLRVVVADDEPLILADLVRLLGAIPGVEVVGQGRNGVEVIDLVHALVPDALFLDVQMPALDGLGVVAELDPERAPAVVFVTAFDRYAVPAFEAHAVDYLLKPFDPQRLRRAVDRVRGRLASQRTKDFEHLVAALTAERQGRGEHLERIAARGVRRTTLIDLKDVLWLEAADNYVRLHTRQGVHLTRRTMKELEIALDPRRFARIHRSTIVALDQVRELRPLGDGDQEVLLVDGTRLILTRSWREAFEARFGGIA
ncbi:LytTR family DNA-binding domain-containing protein [Gemmatimonas aurantiaca]|uniref:LytR/AlgR family response regulator transcription factor n=1 Tax=Gemmatimonas aurantiaca TaxID=173480 RepID=UPI00301DA323